MSQSEPCANCEGDGVVPLKMHVFSQRYPSFVPGQCPECNGTGKIERPRTLSINGVEIEPPYQCFVHEFGVLRINFFSPNDRAKFIAATGLELTK